MIELSKDKIIERFRSYVALDTASDDKSETSPSTAKQLKLAKLLKSELSGLGLDDVALTEYGYVLAALPANTNEKLPVIGLLAHMDTSNEASGANIKMQVHSAYDGSELDLGKGVKLSPKEFPELKNYLGQEIITSDGTTLLGADDKAGVAEIVTACDEAYCDHFIRTLPQGYDTVVSEDSINISGGQKQLLTIARALLANRRLLILDEATSNVDTRTEILLQKAMDKLMRGRTCFVIAHRLSTIVDADQIVVVNDGCIEATGTQAELLQACPLYETLWNAHIASRDSAEGGADRA